MLKTHFPDSSIFITCDVISLVIQGTGGGLASVNAKTNPAPGGHIMLAGIAFQLVIIVLFTCLVTEFSVRYSRNKPINKMGSTESLTIPKPMSRKLRLMSFGLAFNTTCLFIRAVYRLIELSNGWTGRIIRTQLYFNILDGGMITLAIYTLNIFHPGFFLTERNKSQDLEMSNLTAVSAEY
ncbi:hypothetical protein H0H92_005708 [Tricholoma furcatifolium]|nr:hypothetical protein H0H92_005708 [Tricholoma furcatifolium]